MTIRNEPMSQLKKPTQKSYLERLTDEVLAPTLGAIEILKNEIRATMNIPDAPWKILNKTYNELEDWEIEALFDIYHSDGELEPCPMCKWSATREVQEQKKEKEAGF